MKQRSANKKRQSKKSMREQQLELCCEQSPNHRVKTKIKPLEAKTETQGLYISTILHHDITFGIGPAGTGKTYVSTVLACEMLDNDEIDKIVLTRPAIDTESFGALPGELEDKYEPYLAPFMDIFKQRYPEGKLKYLLKSKKIEAVPLAFMRGKTFDRTWVLLDEAQNTTASQMKMILTRIGDTAKIIISGDMNQNDLPRHIQSGLNDAVQRLKPLPEVGVIEFNRSEIVRHGLISKILEQYGE